AEKIINEAEKYGISNKDIIVDPLALTVSADKNAATETLRAVKMLREGLGVHTSLGVSNVSFGLPERELVTSSFFTLALGQGLSAAIMNPHSIEMKKAYHSYLALAGLDESCVKYIEFAASIPKAVESTVTASQKSEEEYKSELQRAIIKGLREDSAKITSELLKTSAPLDIVQNEIIPALDVVGVGFESKTVYLPSLLMSAEAAKSAFEVIKTAVPKDKTSNKATVIIATVKGDIHDIGKNIVKLLLENYGFNTIDLGRDMPAETVVEAVKKHNASIVGLSALMTTTVPAMEETIKLLRETAPECKVIVGGAVLTQEYADMIGADKYAKDAMEAVRWAEQIN
ncbi:MAG: cobalamin-dependent protein, partial [Clostridia bacterium]|nr:cobalamin-dependent protein [Clostridia bacterium]